MILLCTILEVVNGNPVELDHRSTDAPRQGVKQTERHNRVIRQPNILRMRCPSGMEYVQGRCRTILLGF